MKKIILIYFLFTLVACSRRDQSADRDRVNRNLILGEWKLSCLLFCDGENKLVFFPAFYQHWNKASSGTDWKLIADSLEYNIKGETIFLEHESVERRNNRITLLDQEYFMYEHVVNNMTTSRAYNRP